jgi:hypothetical protein
MEKAKKWEVSFEENGGEYYGHLIITGKNLDRKDERNINVDGVKIEFEENIYLIQQK